MNNIVHLILGDWSYDGHGHTHSVIVKSNLNSDEIDEAYQKGSDKLGFYFIEECCADYEDNLLSKEKLDILINNGLRLEDIRFENRFNPNDSFISLWMDSYTDLFLFIVKLGNPEFQYKVLEGDETQKVYIGGYGLFGS